MKGRAGDWLSQLLKLRYSSYFIDTLILNSKSYFNKLNFANYNIQNYVVYSNLFVIKVFDKLQRYLRKSNSLNLYMFSLLS